MRGSDKFLADHYGKKIEKQMTEDIEDAAAEELNQGRKQTPAYYDQPIERGMKVKHGGTIGGKWD